MHAVLLCRSNVCQSRYAAIVTRELLLEIEDLMKHSLHLVLWLTKNFNYKSGYNFLQGKTPQKQPYKNQNAQLSICLWGTLSIAGLKISESVVDLWTNTNFIFRRVNLDNMKHLVIWLLVLWKFSTLQSMVWSSALSPNKNFPFTWEKEKGLTA